MSGDAPNESLYAFWEGRWKSGHTPWDHGAFAPPWQEFVEREDAPAGKVLIPGAGSGHDVRFFAELGAQVTGLDISESALTAARQRNPHPDAVYALGNILEPDPALYNQFDWVIEHTCLCALNPIHWEAYARTVRKVLKPGGHFLALFYRDPHDEEGPPFRIEAETIEALFGRHFTLLRSWIPTKAFESRFGREELRWYRLATCAPTAG